MRDVYCCRYASLNILLFTQKVMFGFGTSVVFEEILSSSFASIPLQVDMGVHTVK